MHPDPHGCGDANTRGLMDVVRMDDVQIRWIHWIGYVMNPMDATSMYKSNDDVHMW